MSISARASAGITPIPAQEQPLSEQFRIVAEEWARLDGEARLLELDKASKFSELMEPHQNLPVARAQLIVERSKEWRDFLKQMALARTEANMAKVRMQWIDKKFSEWQARDATSRAEMRMTR